MILEDDLLTPERAQAVSEVISLLAWSSAARAVPVAEVKVLAALPGAPEWLVTFAAFREAIENAAPPAPEFLDVDLLCISCVAAEAITEGLCGACAGVVQQLAYRVGTTDPVATVRDALYAEMGTDVDDEEVG